MKNRGFSFRNKLIVYFLLVSLLPVVVVQMISYYVSSEAMKQKIDVLVQANLLQTSKNLNTSMIAYQDIVQQIITNDEVIRLVKAINESKDVELSKRELINLLVGYSYAKSGIRSVAIFTSNGSSISYDQQSGSPYYNLWSGVQKVTELPLYKKAMSQAKTLITEPEKIDTINNKEQYGFHLTNKLIDYNSLNLNGIGVVVITVYESVLAQAINLSDTEMAVPNTIDNRNFLVNQDGIIVSSPDKNSIGMRISDVSGNATIQNVYRNNKSGLQIYNQIDQTDLFKEMFAMRRLSVLIGVLALIVSSLSIYFISGRLSSSIRKVLRGMKIAQQGMLTVQLDNNQSRDEISHIAFSFNKMMSKVNELMISTKEAVEKQKEAEIRALEAQINPHFLYNTLDSINWLAIEKDEHQISEMLKGLAQILRYSIKDSNKWVTLQEELKWIEKYIVLQHFRFRSSFQCEVECIEEARGYKIPKLLFQPLIENAIIHGFEGLKQGGILRIEISQIEQMLIISISDNGKGMEETKRQEIVSGASGIGIRNVMERLDIYYKHKARFDLKSSLGEGTVIRLELPVIREGEEK